MHFPVPGRRSLLPSLIATVALAACGSDEIQGPPDPVEGTLTVDASQGWAFASLADEGVVTVTDPASSESWDIGFNATSVMLNGGAAGPGGVEAFCVCQNAGATDEQVLAMTADAEQADFDAVTAVPSGAQFEADRLVPAIDGWVTGTGAAAQPAANKAWLVRLSDETSFAKVRVTGLASATVSGIGEVTLEYAVQPSADAPFGETRTVTLTTLDGGAATADLNTGTTGQAAGAADWDIRLQGSALRLNGGVSGGAKAAATPATEAFEAITTASVDARAYKGDAFAGVLAESPWYRYNLTGDHKIHPTYDVYLVRRGDDVYKVQLVNYYGPAGETRRISFRYAKLDD
jgi:hypothetical protein